MNSTDLYSCSDGRGLRQNIVTTEYWNNAGTDQRGSALISATVTLCFILVGTPSNLLIIVSILWQHLYRQPTYILLLNLAIVDLLTCILVMPFTVISGFAGGFIFGNTDIIRCRLCQLGVLFTLFALLTIHILALLSIDRFLFIKYALKYNKIATWKVYSMACLCTWLICLILSLPPMFGFGDITFGIHLSTCGIKYFGSTRITKNLNYAIFLAIEIVIPLSIIFATNIWVLCIIQKQMRKIYTMKRKSQETKEKFRNHIRTKLTNSKSRKQLQLIKVFGAIFAANIINWGPALIRVLATVNTEDGIIHQWFALYIFLSSTSFAILHPIIEATFIPELRKILVSFIQKKMFCNLKCTWTSRLTSNDKFASCRCSFEFLDVLNASVLPITVESNMSDQHLNE